MKKKNIRLFRLWVFMSLCLLIPIGFGTKWYQGTGSPWINNYGGGLLYEVFWCLVAAMLWPRLSPVWISLSVLGITSLLECLQLWHPPFLETIRSQFIGKTLIGTTFAWWDFPHYIAGCALGWCWIQFIRKSVSKWYSQKSNPGGNKI